VPGGGAGEHLVEGLIVPKQQLDSPLSGAEALQRLLDAEVELRFDRPGLERIQGLEGHDAPPARAASGGQ